MSSSKPIFGYWNVRGLGSPIKLLLEYAGVEYVDKLYKCGPPPTFDRGEWLKDKETLDVPFPNLPYYIDGDVKISQSLVILRYIARKYGFAAKNEADTIRVELLEAQVRDYHMEMARCVYNPDFKNLLPPYLESVDGKLAALAKFLGNNKYVTGDYITYADFLLFEFLELLTIFEEDYVSKHPVLVEFKKRIAELPAIDAYFKSDRAIKYPFNGAPAYVGGPYSDILNKK